MKKLFRFFFFRFLSFKLKKKYVSCKLAVATIIILIHDADQGEQLFMYFKCAIISFIYIYVCLHIISYLLIQDLFFFLIICII